MAEPRIDHWVCADGCQALTTPGMAHLPACRPIYAKTATGGPAEPESASDGRTEAQTGTLLPVGTWTDESTPTFDEVADAEFWGSVPDLSVPQGLSVTTPLPAQETARLLFGVDIDEQRQSLSWLEALHQALGDAIARLKATLPTDAP